jgi:O-antigen/teichoic acid export membrane protein
LDSDVSYLRRGALVVGAVVLGGYVADYAFNLALARFLTPHAYGDFRVAYSFAYFFGFAVLLGGDRVAPKVLAPSLETGASHQVGEYLRFYLGSALGLALVLTLITWAVSYVRVGSLRPLEHHPMTWVVLAVPLNAVGLMIAQVLQTARRPALSTLPWHIGLPVLDLVLFGMVVAIQGAVGVVEAVLIGAVGIGTITLAQGLWARRLGLVTMARDAGFRDTRGWLKASLPMMGSFLVALALDQADLYFLEGLGDDAEVGYFAAAATASHLLLLVQTAIVGLVAPLAAPAIAAGDDASRAAYRRAQRLMLWMTVPVAAALALGAGPALALFKPEYRVGETVLELLVVGNLAWAAGAISSLWLQYQGRAGTALTISVATLAVDSGLNLLLIPRYGMDGAAAGTAVTLAAGALALVVARRRAAGRAVG